jgi:alkanesulfonate monooxygenase SsuD/methylene tetrahydromethanopterin reductase-like flavin-dependent oxidoreductase (luciferase family)
LKVGILQTAFCPAGTDPARVLDDWIGNAVEAERLGYWSCWTTEHHFGSDPSYAPFGVPESEYSLIDYDLAADPLTLLSHVAARTSRLRLGTAVVVLPWDHPIRVAERAALVDVLSGGRLELGVSRGIGFRETQVFDVPTDPAANNRKYHEAIEIVRGAWSGEEFSYDGEFFRVPPVRLRPRAPTQPAPIWVGSASRESAAWAGQQGLPYATTTWPITQMEEYAAKLQVFREAAAEAGNDVSGYPLPHFLFMHCAESDAEAEEIGETYMTKYQYILESHYEWQRNHAENAVVKDGAERRSNVKELARFPVDHHLIGTPETCAERIAAYREDFDLNYLVAIVGWGAMPRELTLASLRRFAEHVLPRFTRAGAGVPA